MAVWTRIGGLTSVSHTHRLRVVDMSGMTIRTWHRFELEAKLPTRFFERRSRWTGHGVEKPPNVSSVRSDMQTKRHRLHGPILREGEWRIMLIDLGRTLEKNDTETVAFSQLYIDAQGSFKPFLGATAKDGTRHLELVVELPLSYRGDVYFDTRKPGESSLESRDKLVPGPSVGKGEGDVSYQLYRQTLRVKSGWYYQIAWDKPDGTDLRKVASSVEGN